MTDKEGKLLIEFINSRKSYYVPKGDLVYQLDAHAFKCFVAIIASLVEKNNV